jgi:hypothetical protein
MKVSRRKFFGVTAAAAGGLWLFRNTGWDNVAPGPDDELNCILLDLKGRCVLRESLHGYQAALGADEHNCLQGATTGSPRRCRMAIVPGLGPVDPATMGMLCDLLEAGTTVLLESGAAFLSPVEFVAHQKMLHGYFDLAVEPPVNLWPEKTGDGHLLAHRSRPHQRKNEDGRESVPYVDYSWPREKSVRDFTRVIPVSAKAGDVIARVGPLPVAVKRRMANGTLIFLGSPLGPALRAGDYEARSWLRLVTAL